MKLINIIGHPLTFMIIYSLLLIEGNDHFSRFYVTYVFMGWQADLLYAKIAATGLLFVFIGYISNGRLQSLKATVYFAGLILMVLSLLMFFENGNKSATFELFIPIMTFTLFAISGICLLYTCSGLLYMPRASEHQKTLS